MTVITLARGNRRCVNPTCTVPPADQRFYVHHTTCAVCSQAAAVAWRKANPDRRAAIQKRSRLNRVLKATRA